jgi:hypothetical protein
MRALALSDSDAEGTYQGWRSTYTNVRWRGLLIADSRSISYAARAPRPHSARQT